MILRTIKYTFLIVAFLCVAGISAYLTLTFLIKSEKSVIVPDLVGRDIVYALEILTDLGLNTKVKGSEYSSDTAKNHVIIQEPGPGMEIKRGRDVRIILSKGTRTVLMPNLEGISIRRAHLAIQENGLCQGNTSYTHSDRTAISEEVISQTPRPDRWVERGTCVNLLVSLGSHLKSYKMENFSGLSLDEAVYLIEKSNLTVGSVKYAFNQKIPEHTIINQSPRAGYRVTERASVSLTINRDPENRKKSVERNLQQKGFFSHRLEPGFFKKRVQVRLDIGGVSSEIYDALMKPHEELWLVVPTHSLATLFCYIDGELARTQVFRPD